ncbi:DUF6488 family protein [Leptospira meyeri]|uniref:DUF6488 family protein n=1 Tax=Leptospira meyeri TaxID=29508 RepID=UPI000C2982B1|nr:DUF6488 family protein [Leptospira meyeri]PJZ79209.1 hypothetical protein CH359_19235 [Leptospira meyeri]PJZ95030.1 hypothetical protein CH358_19265 [Leptospira meyeri]
MKKKLIAFTFAFLISGMFITSSKYAHDHHSHEKLNKDGILLSASKGVSALVSRREKIEGIELNGTWIDKSTTSKEIKKEGKGYYIVSFSNEKVGKILYILISDEGTIYDANFSGQFPGLKDK